MNKLAGLVGEWTATISGAWFLDSLDTQIPGRSTVEWLGESLLLWHTTFQGEGDSDFQAYTHWTIVLGRSDANDQFVALYSDERGVCREYQMSYDDTGRWTLEREDPDMHQRFVAAVQPDRVEARWEASEDAGATWRKDFDVTLVRASQQQAP
jgi:hypothetical protein